MKPLGELCKPRESVFDTAKRDTVLDLTDLSEHRIEPSEFFKENWGMATLLGEAFRRLEGKSEQGVFYLKQAMGGGKTHNLLTLGLLARHPEVRAKNLAAIYTPDPKLGQVRVMAFTGRESDAPFGIWGATASRRYLFAEAGGLIVFGSDFAERFRAKGQDTSTASSRATSPIGRYRRSPNSSFHQPQDRQASSPACDSEPAHMQ
ncbi:MAG TPA: hypothetical protein VF913_14090 [Xanthobacteraceae bacterium]